VEPRAVSYTSLALESALEVPGIDTITLAHGKNNADFARQLVQNSQPLRDAYNRGFLRLLPLAVGDLGGDEPVNDIASSFVHKHEQQGSGHSHGCVSWHHEYTRLLVSPNFWNMLRCDRILTFQSDTVFCRGSQVNIKEFEQYQYIGGETPGIDAGPGRIHMNGGFALRSRPAMLQCIREDMNDEVLHSGYGEDEIYSRCRSLKQPPKELADRFAIDNAKKLPLVAPLGVHKPWEGPHSSEVTQMCDGAQALTDAFITSCL